MSGIPKVLLGLALGLPVGGYAVGSLVATSAEPPGQRAPIILEDPPPTSQSSTPGAVLTPSPEPPTDPRPDDREPDDDGRPEVVVPSYVDRGDDDDDDGDGDDDTDDTDDGDDD